MRYIANFTSCSSSAPPASITLLITPAQTFKFLPTTTNRTHAKFSYPPTSLFTLHHFNPVSHPYTQYFSMLSHLVPIWPCSLPSTLSPCEPAPICLSNYHFLHNFTCPQSIYYYQKTFPSFLYLHHFLFLSRIHSQDTGRTLQSPTVALHLLPLVVADVIFVMLLYCHVIFVMLLYFSQFWAFVGIKQIFLEKIYVYV